jgi:hypothetical protein
VACLEFLAVSAVCTLTAAVEPLHVLPWVQAYAQALTCSSRPAFLDDLEASTKYQVTAV